MGQLPDLQLVEFKRGTSLSAQSLNANFVALLNLAQTAVTLALTPDEAITGVEQRMGALERRLTALEAMTNMHARQRNEKEWAPLAHVGAVLVLARDLERRLARLEQQPPTASQEDHDSLLKELANLAQRVAALEQA